MNAWRRSVAVAAIAGGAIFAWTVGGEVMRTAQYARASQQVEASRQQLATVQDLASVFKTVGKVVEPSVVRIDVTKTVRAAGTPELDMLRQFFPDRDGDGEPDIPEEFRRFHNPDDGGGFDREGTGSGVIMEVNGETAFIVTNNHVASNASEISVTLYDGREITDAKLVGVDPKSDLAVVKINGEGLIPAKWGDSDYLEKGDIICAFGSPFGYVGSMTHGIVSALNRDRVGIIGSRYAYENFIQVDAPINPGNSGGPLVNLRGEVVGINTAIASRTGSFNGIGFAIPSNQARFVYDQIKEKGRVVRGWLGVEINNVSASKDLARQYEYQGTTGVMVRGVQRGGPSVGELEPGDVIVGINGKKIENMSELRNQVAATAPGTDLRLSVVRKGQEQEVTVTLGEQPEETPAVASIESTDPRGGAINVEKLGLRVVRPTAQVLQRHQLPGDVEGALVTGVSLRSPAFMAGLQVGDVITQVDDSPVNSPEDLTKVLAPKDLNKGVSIHVTNSEGERLLFLKTSR